MESLRKMTSIPHKEVMDIDVFLYQKNLVIESASFLKKVENRARQLKTGKIKLIAVFIEN